MIKHDSKERRENAVVVKHLSENIHLDNKRSEGTSSQVQQVELPPVIPGVVETNPGTSADEESCDAGQPVNRS